MSHKLTSEKAKAHLVHSSLAVPCLAGDVRYSVVAGMNLEHAFNFLG